MNSMLSVWTNHRRFWILAFLLAYGATGTSPAKAADDAPSAQAFKVAVQPFRDELWDRADQDLAGFIKQYPESAHVSEAILLQAQSRFQLKRFKAVIDLLGEKLSTSGAQLDAYHYWIAEAQFQLGNFPAAAEAYAQLLKQSPNSPLRLKAAYGEAFARFKLGDIAGTIELLQKPESSFQRSASQSPAEESAVRGYLLLGEALSQQKNYAAATAVLTQLGEHASMPELNWQRQYLLGMIDLASEQAEAALARTTNLLAIATAAGKPLLQAASLKLQAEILESKEPESALQAYDRIAQIRSLPSEQIRQAVLKSVDLAVGLNRLTNAIGRLQAYLALTNSVADPSLDLIRLTLGELHLKQHYKLAAERTNAVQSLTASSHPIQQARRQFDLLINAHTNSPLLGKAYLNRGWCLWEEARLPGGEDRLPEGLAAFQQAAKHLTNSEDQAVARFKWADCQFLQRDFTNAIANYRVLVTSYDSMPAVKAKLFDQALYQLIRACLEIKDISSARTALNRVLAEFGTSPLADDSMLLFGQALLEAGRAKEAREIFTEFSRRFPDSELKPEAELGVARSHAQEADWPSAVRYYQTWVQTHTNHLARPQTEFDLALANYKAGQETNALALFTDLVAKFPSSKLAPLAQLWIADYYFSQGPFVQGAYQQAEEKYQHKIFSQNTNAPSPHLPYRARLMTARAALFRQAYSNAHRHVTNLISALNLDSNAPPHLLSEALFLWATIDLNEPTTDEANRHAKFDSAILKLRKVKDGPLEPRARCLIGYCYMQRAASDAQYYPKAAEELSQVIDLPAADTATRSEARYLLANVLEKQAMDPVRTEEERRKLQHDALDYYLDVIYGKGASVEPKSEPDVYWVNRAGLSAGALAERLQIFPQARRIYERLRETLPSLRETWDKKLESLPHEAKG
jgi:TolA-binding protein